MQDKVTLWRGASTQVYASSIQQNRDFENAIGITGYTLPLIDKYAVNSPSPELWS